MPFVSEYVTIYADEKIHGFNREDDGSPHNINKVPWGTRELAKADACGHRVRLRLFKQWWLKQESNDFSRVECQISFERKGEIYGKGTKNLPI